MTHREELTLKAVEILNKTKGINYRFENVKEDEEGRVSFKCTYPTGWIQEWFWPECWFNPKWTPGVISEIPDEIRATFKNYSGETKILVQMMAYLWTVRNHKR